MHLLYIDIPTLLIVSSVVSFLTTVFYFVHSYYEDINIKLLAHFVSIALWNWFMLITLSLLENSFWLTVFNKITYMMCLFIPVTLVFFLYEKYNLEFKWYLKSLYLLWFSIGIISAIYSIENSYKNNLDVILLFNQIVYVYYVTVSVLYGFYLYSLHYIISRVDIGSRLALRPVFFGSLLSICLTFLFNVIFVEFGNYSYNGLGQFFSIIFIFSTIYSMYVYKLYDIKLLTARTLKYFFYSLYAYITFYGLTFLYTQFFGSVTATEPLLIGIIVAPLFAYFLFKLNYYTDLLNRRLFGELHKHTDVLNEVSHFLSKNLVREDILKYIENILNSFFRVAYSKVVLGSGELIHTNNPYIYVNKIKQDNGNLISIFLPQRSQGEEYSAMDLEMVQAIGSQLSVALERSELYERVSHFAEYLENEVKKKTEQINKQKDELSKLLQSKDEILHIVNHQLNTPLSIIKSAGGMVRDGLWTQEKFYEVTTRESERLGQIIKDFWQAEDTADYRNHLKKENIDLKMLIEKIVEEKRLLIKIRSGEVGLKVLLQQNLPQINCDPAQITQVISNYLDNAIAYTKTGNVTIALALDSDNVVCEVSDTGIGFSNVEKEKLFSKFARTEGARLSRPDGSGLGLYICKRIINAHNGLVWADSSGAGLGSKFGFSLPIK